MIRSFSITGYVLAMFIPVVPSVVLAQVLPPDFSEALVVGGFNEAVGATWDGNGRAYVWEKRGMVWIVENGVTLPAPLIDLRQEVGNWRDYGLLGFTLDPDFLSNGYFYLMYVVDRHHLMHFGTPSYDPLANDYLDATIVRITRYTAQAPTFNTAIAASRTILLGETPQTGAPITHESHGPGTLAFGTDGTLLATIGDAASYNTVDVGNSSDTFYAQALADGIMRPEENVGAFRAQMVNSLSGKILRLDPSNGDGLPSNPWYDPAEPRAPRSRVWAMGLRNAYRFTVKSGSGSTDPVDGEPGAIYLGDVGWNIWEEVNVCDRAGMNFGWPLFEGMDVNSYYWNVPTPNRDAPNPMFNGLNCPGQFFNFQDLIKQETPVHLNAHPNPCDPSVQIPNSIPKHIHVRPWIDYRHGNQSRTKGFLGNVAISYNLNDPNSPVPGPSFGGFAAIGGPTMAGTQFPQGMQNATFFADYAMGFIKRFMFDEENEPISVHDFASGLGAVTWLGAGPDGCIWYIRYNTNELRRICYDLAVDLPPTAVATQDVQYGPTPLTVSFTGSGSSDPNGPVTWHWDFGDGDTSEEADPTHTFTAPPGVPTTYTVVLTVTDGMGQTGTAELIVSLNNTPPVVDITSFADGIFYPVGVDTLIALEALVSDAEHGPAELSYSWQVSLHHNTHIHPEPAILMEEATAVISGVGCDGESYSYSVSLTVTDAGGLSTTTTHTLYPGCHLIAPTAVILADPVMGFAPLDVQFSALASYDPGEVVSYFWDLGDGTTSTDPTLSKTFTAEGPHTITLTVTDDDGLVGQAVRTINVITLDPPQCVGEIGGILREEWSGISGSTINHLISHPTYQNDPTSTTILPSFQGPANYGTSYGDRIRGYIIAPVTGSYVFTVTSDDASAVFLGINSDPATKQLIAHIPEYTLPQEYDKYDTQVSEAVDLIAGVYYYVEVLHKQGNGGDHLTLRWQIDGDTERQVIPGSALAPWEDCDPGVHVRMLLQGAWDQDTGLMDDDLRTAGLIPALEPYTAMGLLASGGGDMAPAGTFALAGQNAIVDWVLIELRDPIDPSITLAARAALLQRDGDVVGADGFAKVLFDVPEGNYHVAVRHRNHLGAMTDTPIQIGHEGVMVDMLSPATDTWGTNARIPLAPQRMGLWLGNVVPDDILRYTGAENDREPILQAIGGMVPTNFVSSYSNSDTNMDGVIKYTGMNNDRDPILVNIGGVVPTAVRLEQLP